VRAIPNSNDQVFEITFAPFVAGGYRLVLGPQITDRAGNAMNQDKDATNGEATQDQFRVEDFTGARVVSSMPHAGGVRVLFDEPVAVKNVSAANFTLTDLSGQNPVTVTGVRSIGGNVYSKEFDIQVSSFPKGGYRLSLGPGIADRVGNLMDQDQDGKAGEALADKYLQNYLDGTRPAFAGITASRVFHGITVAFTEPLKASTFTVADVTLIDQATGKTLDRSGITVVAHPDADRFDIQFAARPGTYELRLGTSFSDLFGNSAASATVTVASLRLDLMTGRPQLPGLTFEPPPVLAHLIDGLDISDRLGMEFLQAVLESPDLEPVINPVGGGDIWEAELPVDSRMMQVVRESVELWAEAELMQELALYPDVFFRPL